ncbi:peptidase inhibitor family I36 protein [Micromonospora sp. NBS 11-29]|uniref:peptidase inhibitor family I36 protein n=1 Tax=Micromonospora sp. NBS 11-29 TaxID=1960879 RepID=UPI000B76D970|nr:peptidase inhibitor family I36 protein [Micromonospora sp. NBS 11-29]
MFHTTSVRMFAAAAAATVLSVLGATAPASADNWVGSCDPGNVCFYTGWNGTGSKCSWSDADPDWANGNIQCSWALTSNVLSVWNNGQSTAYQGVVYYYSNNYNDRAGCTRRWNRGNLQGTYKLRSHQWTTGYCG